MIGNIRECNIVHWYITHLYLLVGHQTPTSALSDLNVDPRPALDHVLEKHCQLLHVDVITEILRPN